MPNPVECRVTHQVVPHPYILLRLKERLCLGTEHPLIGLYDVTRFFAYLCENGREADEGSLLIKGANFRNVHTLAKGSVCIPFTKTKC